MDDLLTILAEDIADKVLGTVVVEDQSQKIAA
jgi:hypothetical protein